MKILISVIGFFLAALLFSGCEFVGDIFKTGIWVGVIIVIAVIAVVAFIVKLFSK